MIPESQLRQLLSDLEVPSDKERMHRLAEVIAPTFGPVSGLIKLLWSDALSDSQDKRTKDTLRELIIYIDDYQRLNSNKLDGINTKIESIINGIAISRDKEIAFKVLTNGLISQELDPDEMEFLARSISRLGLLEVRMLKEVATWPRMQQVKFENGCVVNPNVPELSAIQAGALHSLIAANMVEEIRSGFVVMTAAPGGQNANILGYERTELGDFILDLI